MLTVGLLPPPLKIIYYRMTGAEIGANVSIGPGSVIIGEHVEIGDGVSIGFGTYIRARSVQIGRFARIGSVSFFDAETISIGEDAKISEQVFVGGLSSPESHFRLGARSILMQHTFINLARPVTIGDDTGIGGKCTIFTHGSWQNMLDGYPVAFAPVTIGNNVWIPWQVFIMPGVTIGDGATIGAGSLVTKDVPAGCLAAGSPAKVLRTSDAYPARLSDDQRYSMLRQMISEFCQHLVHAGFEIDRTDGAGLEWVRVTNRNGKILSLVVFRGSIPAEMASRADVLLSLGGMDHNGANLDSEVMWLDLTRKKRGGRTNPLGEELAEYLKRYGIHVARAD